MGATGTTGIADAVERITGRRPGRSTIARWIDKGVGGHRLAARRVGGIWVITAESLRLFLEAVDRTAVTA